MRSFTGWVARTLLILLIATAVSMATVHEISETTATIKQAEGPSIQMTKKSCAGRIAFPVFVESHCTDVPGATFQLMDPRTIESVTLTPDRRYAPDDWYFTGSNLWSLTDTSRTPATPGVRVVSCLASYPGTDWHSSVLNVVHPEDQSTVLLEWRVETTGVASEAYQPSIDCIWLELPDLGSIPAVLSLQVYASTAPYLHWTEPTGQQLPDGTRGESGEDLEASMAMTNVDTSEVYSFAADAYGQVLVPSGTYSLVETANGLEEYFSMLVGQTTLVEIGLSTDAAVQGAPPITTRTFYTGTLQCDESTCSPIGGVTIRYESMDGAVSGSCITEIVETPNGYGSWCEYEYLPGVPTILTVDESTLPAGWVVTSENPQTYLVPENPDGPLGPVTFRVGPA